MNTNAGGLFFGAGIDMNQWRRDITEMRRDILGLNQHTQQQTQQMDKSFKNLSIGIAGYFSGQALMGFTRQLINVRGEFQKTEIAFGTMLKSTDKAKALMGEMVDLAAKTPFSLQDVSAGAKQLLAFQVPANQVVDTLKRMGDIAAGLGVPLSRINLVYGQVKAKGKLMGDDLRQFTEAGIPMLAELANKFGKTTGEIQKMVSEGKIGFKDVKEVLFNLTNEGGMFFNLMDKQSESLSGKISNLGDAFDQMLNKIGESNEGFLGDAINEVTYAIENYEELLEVVKGLVLAYGAYRAAVIVTSVANNIARQSVVSLTFAEMSSKTAKELLTSAQAKLNSTILANPYALATALIVGLTYAIVKLTTQMTTAEEITDKLNNKISDSQKKVESQKAKLESLIITIKSENTTNEEKEAILKQIGRLTDGKIKNLSIEKVKTGELNSEVKEYIKTLYKQAEAMAYVSQLEDLYKVKAEKEDLLKRAKEGKTTIGEFLSALMDVDTYKDGGNIRAFKASDYIENRAKNELKATVESIENVKKVIDEKSDLIAKSENEVVKIIDNATENTKKKAKAHQKALAEIYSKDSIKDLEERISLLNNALERASKGKDGKYKVKLRAKDKYGKEYETGQVVSKDKALAELKALNQAKAKIEEEFRIKTTEEELAEYKRRINLRDKYLELSHSRPDLITEESVDNLFSDLKGKSYIKILEEKKQGYLGLIEAQKATVETTKDLILVEEELNNAKGIKTFMEGVNERIEELKSRFKGVELIEKLASERKVMPGGTEEQNIERNKAYKKALEDAEKEYKKFYNDLLEQQKTYEEKSLELRIEYENIKLTDRYKNANDDERNKIDQAYSKKATDLFFEEMAKKEEWAKMFTEMNEVAYSKLEQFKTILLQKLSEAKTIEEKIKIGEFIKRIDDNLRGRNPFKALRDAIKNISDESIPAQERISQLVKSIDGSKSYIQDAKGIIDDIRGSFDDLGISTDNVFGDILSNIEKTLDGLNQLGDGVATFMKGLGSGNPIQMIGGAIKAVGGLIKSVRSWINGDKKKERRVKQHELALKRLKTAYEDLAHAADKAFGSMKYKGQQDLIQNLKQQQAAIQKARDAENSKKKKDKDKIAEYDAQYKATERAIKDIQDGIVKDILQTDAVDAAAKMGDALVDAFSRGEDSAKSLENVANDLVKNMLKNQMNLMMQDRMKPILDRMREQMGFNEKGEGSFRGLTPEQIARFKADVKNAGESMKGFLEGYKEVFGEMENPDSLKGAIKGMSEETAGLLAGQFNAIRINTGEILKILKEGGVGSQLSALVTQVIETVQKSALTNLRTEKEPVEPPTPIEIIEQKLKEIMKPEPVTVSLNEDLIVKKNDRQMGFFEKVLGKQMDMFFRQDKKTEDLIAKIKNGDKSIDIARSSLLNLIKIEENTRNLIQIRKDLSEMNSKIKTSDPLRPFGL